MTRATEGATLDKLNRLERAIVSAECSAEDARWAQAEEVVRRLDAGESYRAIAASWLRGADGAYGKAGEPYSLRHVQNVASVWRVYHGLQPRPSFSRAYEDAKGETTRPEQAQAQAPTTVETAEQFVQNLQDAPPEVVETIFHGVRETRAGRYVSPARRERQRSEARAATERLVAPIKETLGSFSGTLIAQALDDLREQLAGVIESGMTPEVFKAIDEAYGRFGQELEVARGVSQLTEVI